MNNTNPRAYISISRTERKYSVHWKDTLKCRFETHLNRLNRSFTDEEYAQAVWHKTLVIITLAGVDFIVYIV